MEVSGQLHAQAALPLWKEALVPTNIRECLSPTACLNVLEKKKYLLPLLEIESHFYGCPFLSLVTAPVTLTWFTYGMYLFKLWALY